MKLRRLTSGEIALAREVFGDGVGAERVRLVMGVPTGGWAVTLPGLILFPGPIDDFAAEPLALQAWFVHELTHIRQFRTRPLWTLASWAAVAFTGGYFTRRAYGYAVPFEWDRLNLEQQAKVVEHRFLLSRGVRTTEMPAGLELPQPPITGRP